MWCEDCEHNIHWGDNGCAVCKRENGPCAIPITYNQYCELCHHNAHDQAYGCLICKTNEDASDGNCLGDPYQQYGTWEHESWLLELERQEG